MELLERVDAIGGAAAAIERGFFQEEIGRSAYEQQLRIERGESVVVGVNRFEDGSEPPVIPSPDYSALERSQRASLASVKASRDAGAVSSALDALSDAATAALVAEPAAVPPLMALIIDAVRARASVGEIADSLGTAWGRHRAGA